MASDKPWWLTTPPAAKVVHSSPRLRQWIEEAEADDLEKLLDNPALSAYAHWELWKRNKISYY